STQVMHIQHVVDNLYVTVRPAHPIQHCSGDVRSAENYDVTVCLLQILTKLKGVARLNAQLPKSLFIFDSVWPITYEKGHLMRPVERLQDHHHARAAGIAIRTGRALVAYQNCRAIVCCRFVLRVSS